MLSNDGTKVNPSVFTTLCELLNARSKHRHMQIPEDGAAAGPPLTGCAGELVLVMPAALAAAAEAAALCGALAGVGFRTVVIPPAVCHTVGLIKISACC